jgi:hypothetical protein
MNHTKSSALAVALVGILLLSAGAAAVAPTVDTETTTTATTSEVTDGTVITNFTANASQTSTIQAGFDSQNPKVAVLNEDNETIKSYTGSDLTATGDDGSTYYYNASVNHSVWNDVPIEPNGTTTVYLKLVNNTEATNPDTTNVSITLEGAEGRTVQVVDSDLGSDVFSTSSAGFTVPFTSTTVSIPFIGSSGDTSTYSPSSVPINGSNSTVKIAYRNSTGASSLSSVVDGLSGGAWAKSIVMSSDKGPIKVYADSVPSDVNTSNTYAVHDTDNDDLTVHTGSEYDGETSMSGLSVNANAGFLDRISTYGFTIPGLGTTVDGSSIPGLGMLGAGSSLTAAGAFLFFRPEFT